MMGRQRRDQGRLFYEFRLEDRIPENHLLRRMNVFVTVALADLHKDPITTAPIIASGNSSSGRMPLSRLAPFGEEQEERLRAPPFRQEVP